MMIGRSIINENEEYGKKKKLLIVDDEAHGGKCRRMLKILDENNISYDVALTMEEAYIKILYNRIQYDGIILDRNFPEKKGESCKEKEGDLFLTVLEQQNIKTPVLVHSTALESIPYNKLIKVSMFPWELYKIKQFLNLL